MLGLRCAVQHYDWGSPTLLPRLLGSEPDGRPCAELWMGAHESAPSEVVDIRDARVDLGGQGRPLGERVGSDALAVLGADTVARFGARLPYLFKVLAVARPLSLQVHPDAERAAEGWRREEEAGTLRGAAERTFRDGEHKPELVVALTPFEALSGFRHPARVLELLEGLDGSLAARLRDRVRTGMQEGPAAALSAGFAEVLAPAPRDEVEELVAAVARRVADGTPSPRADATVLSLAQWFPGDPGAVASLFLNRVTLAPGEAMFVPPGAPHAYLEGCALEAMACSDNVLRAGLTTKHIDRAALLACTVYEADGARVTSPVPWSSASVPGGKARSGHSVYVSPAAEFGVVLSDLTEEGGVEGSALPARLGPRIVLCLEGEVTLTASGASDTAREVTLTHGEVVLLTAQDGVVTARGRGRLATAFVPEAPAELGGTLVDAR